MDAMIGLWLVFALTLFVIEPLGSKPNQGIDLRWQIMIPDGTDPLGGSYGEPFLAFG
jgi:hypothetical protein